MWCGLLRKKFILQADNLQSNTQDEEWISLRVIMCIILPVYFSGRKRVLIVKVKVKFTLKQATKAQRGSRCIAILFL